MPHFFCPIFSFETKISCGIVGDAFVLPDLNQQRPKINLDLHESINQPIRAQSVGLSSHIDLVGTQKGKSARTKREAEKQTGESDFLSPFLPLVWRREKSRLDPPPSILRREGNEELLLP